MGNTPDSKPQVEKCLEKEQTVDASMVSLAYSVDSLCATTHLIKDHFKGKEASTKGDISHSTPNYQPDVQQLITMTVLHNKDHAIQSLCDFLHCIRDLFHLLNGANTEECQTLSLDTYLQSLGVFQPTMYIEMEDLAKENVRLKQAVESLEKNIENYVLEKSILTEKNDKLEELNNHLSYERTKLNKTISDLKTIVENEKKKTNDAQLLSENLTDTTQSLSAELKKLNVQNTTLNNLITTKSNEIKILISTGVESTKNAEILNANLVLLGAENERLRADFDDERVENLKVVDRQKSEIQRLETKINDDEEKRAYDKIAKLQEDYKNLELKLQYSESEIGRLSEENEDLKRQLIKAKEDLEKLVQKNKSLSKSIETEMDQKRHLQTEKDGMRALVKMKDNEKADLCKQFESKLDRMSAENEDLKKQLKQTKRDLETLKQEQTSFLNTIETEKDKNRHLGTEKDGMKALVQVKDKEMADLCKKFESEIGHVSAENEDLKRQQKQAQEDLEKFEQENKSFLNTIEAEKDKYRRIETENDGMKSLVQMKDKEMADLCKQLSSLKQTNMEINEYMEGSVKNMSMMECSKTCLQEEIINLKRELEAFKKKRRIQVQIYYQRRGGLITNVEEELIRLLKSKMETEGKLELEFIKHLDTSDVNKDVPLLLLCICASRIGTDAANTIQGIDLTPKMSLLIFHHKDEHALPNQASYQVLTGKEFTMLGCVCDFAFLTGKGIYSCAMNEASIEKVVHFIDTEGTKK